MRSKSNLATLASVSTMLIANELMGRMPSSMCILRPTKPIKHYGPVKVVCPKCGHKFKVSAVKNFCRCRICNGEFRSYSQV
jgi:hypothetical protein